MMIILSLSQSLSDDDEPDEDSSFWARDLAFLACLAAFLAALAGHFPPVHLASGAAAATTFSASLA